MTGVWCVLEPSGWRAARLRRESHNEIRVSRVSVIVAEEGGGIGGNHELVQKPGAFQRC